MPGHDWLSVLCDYWPIVQIRILAIGYDYAASVACSFKREAFSILMRKPERSFRILRGLATASGSSVFLAGDEP
jgi:hypothetical protein